MTDLEEPVFASQITPESDRTAAELKASQIRKAVQARKVRRDALKGAGMDEPVGSPDLHERLERRRLEDRQKRVAKSATKKLTPAEIARKTIDRKVKP